MGSGTSFSFRDYILIFLSKCMMYSPIIKKPLITIYERDLCNFSANNNFHKSNGIFLRLFLLSKLRTFKRLLISKNSLIGHYVMKYALPLLS